TDTTLSRDYFPGLTYANLETLSLAGDPNSDSAYNINSTGAAVHITDAGGNDYFNVGTGNLDFLPGAVSIDAGPGYDTINVNDDAVPYSDPYTINGTTFTRMIFGGLTYANTEALVINGEGGDNVYNATGVLTSFYINEQFGTNT